MSKSQRLKGQRGERKVNNKFRRIFPQIERNLNDVREEQGIDHVDSGNLAIQTKHRHNHVPVNTIKEVKPSDGRIPVLVSWPTKRGLEPRVVIESGYFGAIVEDIRVAYDTGSSFWYPEGVDECTGLNVTFVRRNKQHLPLNYKLPARDNGRIPVLVSWLLEGEYVIMLLDDFIDILDDVGVVYQ